VMANIDSRPSAVQPLATYDAIVVGAGFAGATVARELAERGDRKVVVLERRDHIGGNAYDHLDDNGVLIHKFGPHIFHTTNERVFDYLSRFTAWNGYSHEVLADVFGTYLPVPFNKVSLRIAFGAERGEQLIAKLVDRFGDGTKVPISELRGESDPDLNEIADYVWNNVFLHYTTKQWGKSAEQIDPSVTARVPVFISEDCRYFTDPFQGLPTDGYTAAFERLLDHPAITVQTGVDAKGLFDLSQDGAVLIDGQPYTGTIVYTGPLDELFGYRFGPLPYRSLDFVFETHDVDQWQPRGTINYTVSEEYTRITEFKHLTRQVVPGTTTIVREYSRNYEPGAGIDPYYPEVDETAQAMHAAYLELAASLPAFHALGRLAEYRYYNMDATVANALDLADRLLEESK
jgi:UDP-galactopyranose mutase